MLIVFLIYIYSYILKTEEMIIFWEFETNFFFCVFVRKAQSNACPIVFIFIFSKNWLKKNILYKRIIKYYM